MDFNGTSKFTRSLVFFFFFPSFEPITRRQILDWSKLKEFADDNFKFEENGRKLSKQVKDTVGKGEIARYEQFLLFPQCFQKACFPGASKGVVVWEWVKKNVLLPHEIRNRNMGLLLLGSSYDRPHKKSTSQ